MSAFQRCTWQGFLPARALVMARVMQPKIELPVEPSPNSLRQISVELSNCSRCKLSRSRTQLVFGEGNPQARLVFLGEGPGEQEDLQGRPFVGEAGQLLDRMIEAMGLTRQEVYLTNVVKCRPPGDRDLEMDEIQSCNPYLDRQLKALQSQVIVALGKSAAQTLLKTDESMIRLRGRFHPLVSDPSVLVMPTYHPAYLLKNPAAKKETWLDLQQVAKQLGIKLPQRK